MSRNSESLVVHWEISAVFGTMTSVDSSRCAMTKAPMTVFPNPVGAERIPLSCLSNWWQHALARDEGCR